MRKYLVTGGCGFIGSHLCEALLKRGDAVRILDDLSTGKNRVEGAEVIVGCVTDENVVAKAIEEVDGVFHLAAIPSVERSIERWTDSHRVNLLGTLVLLEAIKRKGTLPFLYASSAAVYGQPRELPLKETTPPALLSPYGADKFACEQQAALAWKLHQIPSIGLRLFNVYGPRQDPHSPYSGVISIFVERLKKGLSLTIFGNGEQQRDFISIQDVVPFFIDGMEKIEEGSRIFNVCTGIGTSVNTLVSTLEHLLNVSATCHFAPSRKGDIQNSIGDPHASCVYIRRAQLTLEDGLAHLLNA